RQCDCSTWNDWRRPRAVVAHAHRPQSSRPARRRRARGPAQDSRAPVTGLHKAMQNFPAEPAAARAARLGPVLLAWEMEPGTILAKASVDRSDRTMSYMGARCRPTGAQGRYAYAR